MIAFVILQEKEEIVIGGRVFGQAVQEEDWVILSGILYILFKLRNILRLVNNLH